MPAPLTDSLVRRTLAAIRRKCLDCCGGCKAEVDGCQIKTCSLYIFRLGDPQGDLLAADKEGGEDE